MNTYADKTKENSQTGAKDAFQKQSLSESTFQLVDNRPEASAQRKLQETAINTPQFKQAAQLQAMVNNLSTQQPRPIQKKENNTGLPDDLKTGVEDLSGYSMDDVKVHYNSDKPAQLQAHAYAQGTDIHLASGQEKHLPHEAWHVVQQKQGRVMPTVQMKGSVNVNDDVGLEKEADVMGAMALQKKAQNQTSLNTSANISTVRQLTTIAQRIIKPDTTRSAFMRDNDYNTKPKKTKEAIEAFFDSVKKSALIYTPEEMAEGIRIGGGLPKNINSLFAKMEGDKSVDMDEDLGGERAHGVSRHLTISDDNLEARLRGPGAIAVATRFQTEDNSGRAVLKLYNQIKGELPVFLKKHVGRVADDVLKIVKGGDYMAAANNAARRILIRDGAEINAPIIEDFNNFSVTVNWEATNANCIANQATIRCIYTVESSDEFAKDSWSLNAMGAVVKNAVDATATMHSGGNSPVIIVLATDTSSSIEGKVAASNVNMVGVTMY